MQSVEARLKRAEELLNLEPAMVKLLSEPMRALEFRIPLRMDDGRVEVFSAYRVYHNDALGPTGGGTRIAPFMDMEESKALEGGDEGKELKTAAEEDVRQSLLNEVEELKRSASQSGRSVVARIETVSYVAFITAYGRLRAIRLLVMALAVEQGCGGSAGVSIPEGCGLEPVAACIRMLEEAKQGKDQSR